jgi:hypothetical protein
MDVGFRETPALERIFSLVSINPTSEDAAPISCRHNRRMTRAARFPADGNPSLVEPFLDFCEIVPAWLIFHANWPIRAPVLMAKSKSPASAIWISLVFLLPPESWN